MIRIGACRHALADVAPLQQRAEGLAAVLAAPVAVEDEALGAAPCPQRLLQGIDDQVAAHVIGQGPADDAPRAEVDDDGQVEPFVRIGDEGNVARPDLVGAGWQGLAQEQIGRGGIGAAVAGFWRAGLRLEGAQALLLHEPPDAAGAADDAFCRELLPDATVTVAPSVMMEDGADGLGQRSILHAALRGRGGVVIAAARHLENRADTAHTVPCGVGDGGDHLAQLSWGLEPRIIAAFFKMSFSAWRRA